MRGLLRYTLRILLIIFTPLFANAQLSANFTADITSGCSPIVVNFSDLSTGSPTSWSWNLGNGTSSTLQNPSTTYTAAGTYTVTLTVSDGTSSNTKTVTGYITVKATPSIAFTASDSSAICPPKTVSFTNNTVPGVSGSTSYTWDFGDGTSSTITSPTHAYNTPGNYNVTLVATNSSGCTASLVKSSYIQVHSKPTSSFTASNTIGCSAPFSVSFTDSSTGATSYTWNFGDGSTDTVANPNHTYSSAGTYTVKLISTNSNGCTDTATKTSYINVHSLNASFTSSSTSACPHQTISFTNTSTGASTYHWDFGDGGTSTSKDVYHFYSSPGTYTVTMIISNDGCHDTAKTTITVHSAPSVAFSGDTLSSCKEPQIVNFTNSSSGATSYLWRFGDGSTSTSTSPSHTYNSFNNFSVQLIATNSYGCKDSLTKNNYVKIQPLSSSITASPSNGCVSLTVNFSSSVTASLSSYHWDFGDGSSSTSSTTPSHTYTSAGTFTVKFGYRTTTGCVDTVTTTVIAANKPHAAFTASASPICASRTISFVNSSTGATSYTWNFGDGNLGVDTNPTHIYSYPDTFTVTLIAKNGSCRDTLIDTDVVKVIGTGANFTPGYDCGNRLKVNFTNTSRGGVNNTWSWYFGDGDTSSLKNPSHTYSSYGTDTVTLITSDTTICHDTLKIPVTTYPMNNGFTASDTSICKGTPINFYGPNNTHTFTYHWIFGDGTTGSQDSLSKTYTSSGNYTVKLAVSDSRGCSDTSTRTNYIHVGGPNVSFSASPIASCIMSPVYFTDATTDAGITITSRYWTFGDGGSLGGNNSSPSHEYSSAGGYNVKLVVVDTNGCKDSLTQLNYIHISHPTASFTTSDTVICPGSSATFTDNSLGADYHSWYFGDGDTSTATNPTHTYTSAGTYTVTLIVSNTHGCSDTMTKTALVHVNSLDIGFNMSDSFANCPPLTVNLTNTSSGISSYNWKFGNGNGSVLTNPTSVYTYPGTYHIKLIGTAANGCKDSVSKSVTINGPRGTLSYTPTNGCAPVTINFTSLDTNTTAITWDMNNGYTHTASTSSSTTCTSTYSYTYTTPGKYIPVVVLSEGSSCNVYVRGIDTIRVDKIQANFTYTPDSFCGSGTVHFTDTAMYASTVASRNWSFGDGSADTSHNPSHTYTGSGTYTVRLIESTLTGCDDTVTKTIVVLPKPSVNAGSDKAMCYGGTAVTLSATGADSYSWSPSTGLSCDTCASPTATPGSTTTYVVTGTDSNGCSNTDTVKVTVHTLPTINAGSDKTICAGTSAGLSATGASSYTWSPSTGLSCTSCTSPTATPTGTTSYSVTGTDSNGCTNTDTVVVKVNSLPTVYAGHDTTICGKDSITLTVTGASTYSWTPTSTLSCSTCATTIAKPTSNTTYVVTGTDTNSCTNKDTILVSVYPVPTVNAGADRALCYGSNDTLHVTGASTYVWTPTTGLSCNTCADPIVSATSTTTYHVTGTDINGCTNKDSVKVSINPLPNVDAGPDTSTCSGNMVTLNATGATSYIWSPAAGLSCTTCSNPTITVSATLTYYVTGTDANGCKKTDSVTVNMKPAPTVSAGPDQSICKGSSTKLFATGADTYKWSPGGNISCTNCDTTIASPITTTMYTVVGTAANGCKDTDQIQLTVNPLPTLTLNNDTTVCDSSYIQLNVSGASTYTWSPAASLSCATCSDPIANVTGKTTYTVVGTDSHGCIDSDKVTLSVIYKQPTNVGPGDTLCKGESAQLSASGGTDYLWIPEAGLNDNNSANPTATPDTTTNYMVIIKQGECFIDTGHTMVYVYPVPHVTISGKTTLLMGDNTQLYANGTNIVSYEWTPSDGLSCITCPGPTASPTHTTTYTVNVTGEGGCKAKADITINVRCDNSQIFIPNTFTPNGDGLNDRFYPSGKGIGTIKRFSIYNRWGQLIYQVDNMPVNDPAYGWDGSYNGKPVKPDVFVYIIDATCISGEPLQLKGDISVVR